MGSVEDRIRKLEQRQDSEAFASSAGPYSDTSPERRRRHTDRVLHLHENARREMQGLEPLPMPPHLEKTREDVLETLRETIPAYRQDPGWQTEEARAFLDHWQDSELETLDKVEREDKR